MAEESTSKKPLNTVNSAIEEAKKTAPSYNFPSDLGVDSTTELHSYIEFIVVKESTARQETINAVQDFLGVEEKASGVFDPASGDKDWKDNPKTKVMSYSTTEGFSSNIDPATGEAIQQQPADPTTTKINTRVEAKSTIRLFIPENLQTPTAAQYDSQTMGTIGAAMTNFVGGSFGDLKDVGAGGNLGQSAISEVVQTAGNLLGGGAGDVINQAVFGRAANAAKYLLFKGIDFRKFQFQYNFVPRNIQESQDLEKIIKIFRQAMLPDIVSVGFYDIPQEFEIQYVIQKLDANGKLAKAPVLHRFKKCNLEECNVTYGSNGRFTLTKDGYPANIQLSLTFSENEQVTRKDIPEGF